MFFVNDSQMIRKCTASNADDDRTVLLELIKKNDP